jgi:hypothetical protein
MKSSEEVFCVSFDIYNSNDPKWQPFYNFGGWLYLEPEYAKQRPYPDVSSVSNFTNFLNEHNFRYVVIAPGYYHVLPESKGKGQFEGKPLEGFSSIYKAKKLLILKRNT